MGISRDSFHKRRATGARRAPIRMKRKYELGRPAAMTRLGEKRVHEVRTRGGNRKFRALRLDQGNFAWGTESVTFKARLMEVVYNASNNELVRTNTLVKGCIVQIDAHPFRHWYESHYGIPLGRKKNRALSIEDQANLNKARSHKTKRKIDSRKKASKVDTMLEEQFVTGRVYARVSSRPGQSGRCDGYILEGKELEFYRRKLRTKKGH